MSLWNCRSRPEGAHILTSTIPSRRCIAAPIKPFQVKNHLWIFVNASIENPSFDSQTKEHMTLAQNKFGSKCKVSEDFTKKGGLQTLVTQCGLRAGQADLRCSQQ